MADFSDYITEKKKEGKTSIKITDDNDFAWCSGFASFLMDNYYYINHDNYFIAYLNKPKEILN